MQQEFSCHMLSSITMQAGGEQPQISGQGLWPEIPVELFRLRKEVHFLKFPNTGMLP